jgi:hypothetical protein
MKVSIRCQVDSSWGGGVPEPSPRSKRLSQSTEHSSWSPLVHRAVMSPPSALCTYSTPGRGEGGIKFRRLPPIPCPSRSCSRSRLSCPELSPQPSLTVARRCPLSSDTTKGRIMGMRFGGFPPRADLPKVGFPKPCPPWAVAKRANPDVVVVAVVEPCCD